MEKGNPEFQLRTLLASYEQANHYLRDTSRRIEEHVKFYLTGATAIVGAVAYAFVTVTNPSFNQFALALGTFALFGLGVVTFLRLINIKAQATQHTARLKGVEYSLNRLAFGSQILLKYPRVPPAPSGPFSKLVVFILTWFGIFNSLVFGICVSVSANILFGLLGYQRQTLATTDLLALAFLGLLASVASVLLHRRELNTGWKQAFVEYADVLKWAILTPEETHTER